MCSVATDGEMKLSTYVGKGVSLSPCFVVSHRSYTYLRDKLYYVSGLYLSRAPLCLFRAVSVIFLGLHTVRFSRCIVYVFCACVTKKNEDSNIYWLDRKIINFCDKTVIFHFSLYFHLCNKNTESHGKNLIWWILRKMSCDVSLNKIKKCI